MDNFSKYLVADYLDKHNYLLDSYQNKKFGVKNLEGLAIIPLMSWKELSETIFDLYHEEFSN